MEEQNEILELLEKGSQFEIDAFLHLIGKEERKELLRILPTEYWKRFMMKLNPTELIELLSELPKERWNELLSFFHPSDLADLLSDLPQNQWAHFFDQLEDETLAEVLTELEEHEVRQALTHIELDELPDLLSDMASDDAADILAELSEKQAQKILSQMPEDEAQDIVELLQYPDDSAGGLMQTELVSVKNHWTIAQSIRSIQKQVKEEHDGELGIYSVFVVDKKNVFLGQVSLEKIILAEAEDLIQALIDVDERFFVYPDLDQEEVAEYFQKYNLVALPVVNSENKLIGRITVDDIVDVMEEEATEDIFQMAGVDGEEMVADKTIRSASLRLPWLASNLVGGLITGMMAHRLNSDLKVAALIAFVPLIMGMGGNVGTQSSSLTIRGFALGRIDMNNVFSFFWKELRVGAVMGVVCGLLLTIIGGLWFGKPQIGLVVGISLFFAMTFASSMGTLFPAFFEKIGVDSALAAGPFVTTFNDIMGLFIYYCTAVIFQNFFGL